MTIQSRVAEWALWHAREVCLECRSRHQTGRSFRSWDRMVWDEAAHHRDPDPWVHTAGSSTDEVVVSESGRGLYGDGVQCSESRSGLGRIQRVTRDLRIDEWRRLEIER
jgi:hypothetical protein